MIKNTSFISSSYSLKAMEFPAYTIMQWIKTLKALSEKNIEIVEVQPENSNDNHWGLIIDSITHQNKELNPNYQSNYKRLNDDLKKQFDKTNDVDSRYWNNLFSSITLSGFNIPVDDIKKVNYEVLRHSLIYYHLYLKYFQYKELFISIQRNILNNKNESDDIAIVAWDYIYYYSKFLHEVKKNTSDAYKEYYCWYTERIDLNNLYRRLPSEQITALLLIKCESALLNKSKYNYDKTGTSKACEAVKLFFDKYHNAIEIVLERSKPNLNPNEFSIHYHQLQTEFSNVFEQDKDELLVQEALDNRSKLDLHNSLPILLQIKHGPNSPYNLTNIIKDKIFDSDDKQEGLFQEDTKVLPKYGALQENLYSINFQKWYDIMPVQRKSILKLMKQNSSGKLLEEGLNAVDSRMKLHSLNLINQMTIPVVEWEYDKRNIYPRWNLFDNNHPKSISELYHISKEKIAIEEKLLEEYINQIAQIQTTYNLNQFLISYKPSFIYYEYQQRWNQELQRNKVRIQQKQRYFNSRMKELGIYEAKLDEYQSHIYLKEMLLIEQEIRPYVQYVKKAFQSALPIRNKVGFSQNRHTSDGVEFDPDTLFDQEKWVRAEVMKAMESSIQRGEAIQINTFCLDYSGSMNHARMRNLFKILYLLVLGLEDRKSYDAFHFFNHNFIEVVNFTNEFTHRKVLFKILQQISKIDEGRLVFSGTNATNISEGVKRSHEKMKEFVTGYKSNYPESNIVTSLFVISDGEPTIGITDLAKLNQFIAEKRKDGDVEIKGIYIKDDNSTTDEDLESYFMKEIFGDENYVETTDFKEGVNKFVKIMTETYKKQRKAYKWKNKKRKLGLTD